MKNLMKITTVLSFLAFGLTLTAQEGLQCGTIDQTSMLERITANRAYIKANPSLTKNSMEFFIPIRFILVGDSQGNGRLRYPDAIKFLCALNELYEPFDMTFYLDNNGTIENPDYFTLVDNTFVFTDPRNNTSQFVMRQNKEDDALNVFVVQDTGGSGATTSAAYYSPGNDWIVTRKTYAINSPETLAHEVGHLFSLAHPHTGWEDTAWGSVTDPSVYTAFFEDGDTITQTLTPPSSQSQPVRVELVNGSNCTLAGDNICDTPADYGTGPHSGGCVTAFRAYDRNFELLAPDGTNIMSYFDCNNQVFTNDQIEAVRADYLMPNRSYLRHSYEPALDIISGPPVVTSPATGVTTDFYNGVSVEWEPVAGATQYLVELTRTGAEFESIWTDETGTYLDFLDSNANYFLYVHALNDLGACAVMDSPVIFKTGTAQTAVIELDEVSSFNIFPNPSVNNATINVNLELEQALNANMSIQSINGKVVYSDQVQLNQGQNNQRIDTSNFAKGVYLFKLQTENGIVSEKIVIQ